MPTRSFLGARAPLTFTLALAASALFAVASCTGDGSVIDQSALDSADASVGPTAEGTKPSEALVQRGPRVSIAYPESSPAFSSLPLAREFERDVDHEPLRPARTRNRVTTSLNEPDSVTQTDLPIKSMPAATRNFAGQGGTFGGTPPDTNGAVGLNHYVQTVNVNLEMWNKNGTVAAASRNMNSLWTGYVGTNAGNGCGADNDGDPVVLYDQLADRWFLTQFSLPNSGADGGPAFQCVAVSKTGDPTGAYWLYDFRYPFAVDDYGKFGVWPDAYYANFHQFDATTGFKGDDFCAYDRAKMIAGQPASQQCFLQTYNTPPQPCPAAQPFNVFGAQPISVDGPIKPPAGAPGYFLQFDYSGCGPTYNTLDLWKFHVDWTTPANSTVTGPTAITVANFTPTCFNATGTNCIPQGGSTVTLDGLDDRLMFRFTYRNFGAYESLLVNHSVMPVAGSAGSPGSGARWYELRLPNGTPTVFQQGTYAPNDTNYRWMGSIAQDQSNDMALGFAISSKGAPGVAHASIGWTGRLVSDAVGTMGQGETVIDTGTGSETDAYPPNKRGRWGDYSNMSVDPADDCTFWYTQELYNTVSIGSWSTFIANVKFPRCAANDFSISVAPASQSVAPGGNVSYTVTTASTKGAAETIALYVQDLPVGVSGVFTPATVTAGTPSTLKLTATNVAPTTPSPVTFTVIGKAPSAVHAATAQVSVGACQKLTQCPAPDNCGTISDNCGGTLNCGTCAALDQCHDVGTCTSNVCSNPPKTNGTACTGTNLCNQTNTCQAGVCTGSNPVVCNNADACHNAGTCAPATGTCSTGTPKSDGTSCTGTDKCNQAYACLAGTCTGSNPVTCTAQDECHDVGTCDGTTGSCSNPSKADGTACSLGTCQSGTCTPNQQPDAGTDSGVPDSGARDSGAAHDASTGHDSSTGADGSTDDGGTGGPGSGGGCGCRTVQPKDDAPIGLGAAGGLGLLAVLRLRRRRR